MSAVGKHRLSQLCWYSVMKSAFYFLGIFTHNKSYFIGICHGQAPTQPPMRTRWMTACVKFMSFSQTQTWFDFPFCLYTVNRQPSNTFLKCCPFKNFKTNATRATFNSQLLLYIYIWKKKILCEMGIILATFHP